jgi:hypothetical protein
MTTNEMAQNSPPKTVRTIRWIVTITLLIYGLAKLIGPQFKYNWHEITFRHDDPNAYKMVFYFYGYSRVYGTFIAVCELLPAVLLLVPRTATIGAAAIFAVMLNITVMDWTYGLPLGAQLVATGLLVASAFLLWTDRRKLAPLFAADST